MQKSKKIEIIGLTLILISFFIQTFVFLPSKNITDDSIRYKIETKLDTIYSITRANYQKLNPNIKEPIFWVNPKEISNDAYAGQDDSLEDTLAQTKWLNSIVAFVFIIGSILLIIAKRIEYNHLKRHRPGL